MIVHNIDSGPVTGAVGAWRRLRSPASYSCPLCGLTRGIRGVNPRWQSYLDTLSEPVHTLTRDQFRAAHAPSFWRNVELPSILMQTGSKLERLVSAGEIRRCTSIQELSAKVDAAIKAHPA